MQLVEVAEGLELGMPELVVAVISSAAGSSSNLEYAASWASSNPVSS